MATKQIFPAHDQYQRISITDFSREVFGHLPRQDQRQWAETYLKGLLSTPGRKSVRRMAAAVSGAPTASQSLHQFVSSSPWPWEPSRGALADWTGRRAAVRAWNLVPIVVPKRGRHSVGVHRRFDAAAGRVINCQIGVGLLLSTRLGDLPVDWRLHLPAAWCGDPLLRRRARIPDSGDARSLWALGLELVDAQYARSDGRAVPVVADARDLLDPTPLVNGLSGRGARFVLCAAGSLVLRVGSPFDPRWQANRTVTAEQLCVDDPLLHRGAQILAHSRRHRAQHSTARWSLSGPVHLPRTRHTLRLLATWHPRHARPARIWLTNLMHADVDELIDLAGTQLGTNSALQSLQTDFGLFDFEGRSFPGWHHHMTLVSAAYDWHELSAAAGQERGTPRLRIGDSPFGRADSG
ncbi:transposase [Streptomyces niveiscabiei]|uniref:IS701 family transposase n=1 Tax=Streptomyces niveiscabiei TaxID=164115 RepID=UPI0029BDC6F0|nr:transposase [Streptomyces niveiscabiei]MDX3381796.1 transposase [Streptomyces niveiscabiei]